MSDLTYSNSGVNIAAGDELVEEIKPLCKSTSRKGADALIGGFGGLFDLKAAGYTDPILVAGTDGVGTKLKIAVLAGVHGTVGIDLVAMSVNDILVQGAEPLFFLDYYATGKLDSTVAKSVISGIAEGCRQAGCALIGGETAEMPSMYAAGDYDLAGFAVGAAERGSILPRLDSMKSGDILLGLASNGLHSNGFSLVRTVVAKGGLDWFAPPPFQSASQRLCDALLDPTRIYVKSLIPLLRDGRSRIKGLAHITGGGLEDNLSRILPNGLSAELGNWTMPPVFEWLRTYVSEKEMRSTFNCGIGMVIVCSEEDAESVKADLEAAGENVQRIGRLVH